MKKIIFLLFLIPVLCKAQNETITVTLQARDCEYIGSFTGELDFYQDLDSLLKNKFRPAVSAPSGTTSVVITGVTTSVWLEVDKKLRRDATALIGNNNPYTRLDAALRVPNNAWLTTAIDADIIEWDLNGYSEKRGAGRRRLKRE